jgi:hypothetical protein
MNNNRQVYRVTKTAVNGINVVTIITFTGNYE